MSDTDLSQNQNEFLQAANHAADQSAQILLSYFDNLEWVAEKDQAGLVTEADQKSEETIKNILLSPKPLNNPSPKNDEKFCY